MLPFWFIFTKFATTTDFLPDDLTSSYTFSPWSRSMLIAFSCELIQQSDSNPAFYSQAIRAFQSVDSFDPLSLSTSHCFCPDHRVSGKFLSPQLKAKQWVECIIRTTGVWGQVQDVSLKATSWSSWYHTHGELATRVFAPCLADFESFSNFATAMAFKLGRLALCHLCTVLQPLPPPPFSPNNSSYFWLVGRLADKFNEWLAGNKHRLRRQRLQQQFPLVSGTRGTSKLGGGRRRGFCRPCVSPRIGEREARIME